MHEAPRRGTAAHITAMVETWDGVTSHPHRFGGVEFRAGGRELGHLHGDRLADLLVPKAVHDRALAEGIAQTHHVLPDSNWISVYLHGPSDAETVIALLRESYERAMKRPIKSRTTDWSRR
jgi:hypothetical protein